MQRSSGSSRSTWPSRRACSTPAVGQPDRDRDVAVQELADAVLALAVAGEERALHGKRMLRYESTRSMPIES